MHHSKISGSHINKTLNVPDSISLPELINIVILRNKITWEETIRGIVAHRLQEKFRDTNSSHLMIPILMSLSKNAEHEVKELLEPPF